MVCRSTTWISVCRPLSVVNEASLSKSAPSRCCRACITTRNCGSVRMPVIVPIAGEFSVLRRPPVINWSEADEGIAVPGEVPGKNPWGLPVEGAPLSEG